MDVINPLDILDGIPTRASSATRVNETGKIELVGVDIPRYTFDPLTLEPKGMLIEAASTNLLLYSEQLDNAAWTKTAVTVTANAAVSPDGSATADKIIATAANTLHQITQAKTVIAGNMTASFYVKAAEYTQIWMFVYLDGSFKALVYASALDGAGYISGVSGAFTSKLTKYLNGWFRVELSGPITAGSFEIRIQPNDSSFLGDGVKGMYVWGVQVEQTAAATSYMPSVATAFARAADISAGSGMIFSNVPQNDALAWVPGTYGLGDQRVKNHHIFESLTAGNTADPTNELTAVKKWQDLGAVNRWRMFDKSAGKKWLIGKITTNPELIQVSIKPDQVINAIAFFGLSAASVRVIMTDADAGVVYDVTTPMATRKVSGWYEYFFKKIARRKTFVSLDLPAYRNAMIDVFINNPGSTAAVNYLSLGSVESIGNTEYGLKISNRSYSVVTTDAFGNEELTPRPSRRIIDFPVQIQNNDLDRVIDLMDGLRDTPAVYIGYAGLQCTITLGRYEDLNTNIPNYGYSDMSLEVRSMT